MRMFYRALFISLCLLNSAVWAQTLHVVAAENVYGDVAQQLGQNAVQVDSILNNPNQDPHLFSSHPSTNKVVADADVLIYNGADYDAWFQRMLSTHTKKTAIVINVAQLVELKSGANPHLWYRLSYVNQLAQAITAAYQRQLPSQSQRFSQNLHTFLAKQLALQAHATTLKQSVHGLPITATEPVANYLAEDLALLIEDQAFQMAVMNDTEPSAKSRADMQAHLKNHTVKALIYNQQVQDPVTEGMQNLAQQQHIPVIGVTELLPTGEDYQTWYQHTLDRFAAALAP